MRAPTTGGWWGRGLGCASNPDRYGNTLLQMTILYLPITSQPREMESKLLLGLMARERGLTPVIGYKSTLLDQLETLKAGTFIAHNARQKVSKLKTLRKFNHRVLVLDEEALVRQSDEIFFKKHPKDAFAHVDGILCWGDNDAAIWEHFGVKVREGCRVVGNPRMDILRTEFASKQQAAVEDIKARFGRYVLLNTNFPIVNNITPRGGGLRIAPWAMDERGRQVTDLFVAEKQAMLQAELDLVAPLAMAIAPVTLIIRPHPNEDHTAWIEAAAGLPNVKVVFEGGVVPWILGAEALIHNGCTTGVEMAVAGRPVLNYVPQQLHFEPSLANSFGKTCATPAELIKSLKEILGGQALPLEDEQKRLLRHHVANYDGALSCDRIIDAILERPIRPLLASLGMRLSHMTAQKTRWLGKYARLHLTSRGIKRRRLIKALFPGLQLRDLDSEQIGLSLEQLELLARQFPPLRKKELDRTIMEFSQHSGMFQGRQVRMLSHFHFTIE